MSYSPRAAELRRCIATRADGSPCRAWAVWGDAGQHCAPHGGRAPAGQGGRRQRGHYIPCTCPAYAWRHRPGAGLCRWPDPPAASHPRPAGLEPANRKRDRAAEHVRGIARRMRKVARSPAPIPPQVSFAEAWERAELDPEPPIYGEAAALKRARWRLRRGDLTDQEAGALAWAAVPQLEREQMVRRLEAGHWGGLRRVEGHPAEWALYYGRWKIRGLWDRPRERLVVLAVIAVC